MPDSDTRTEPRSAQKIVSEELRLGVYGFKDQIRFTGGSSAALRIGAPGLEPPLRFERSKRPQNSAFAIEENPLQSFGRAR